MLRRALIACAFSAIVVAVAPAQASVANKIVSLHVYRFHVDRAAFDTVNLLAPGADSIDLLNVDSPALLVLAALDGAFKYDSAGLVRLTVTVDNKPVTEHAVRLRQFLYSPQGKISVPFIVYGMLCGTYEIKAQIVRGGRNVDERAASIQFQCGD